MRNGVAAAAGAAIAAVARSASAVSRAVPSTSRTILLLPTPCELRKCGGAPAVHRTDDGAPNPALRASGGARVACGREWRRDAAYQPAGRSGWTDHDAAGLPDRGRRLT